MRPKLSFDMSASVALWPMLALTASIVLSGCVSADNPQSTAQQVVASTERLCSFVPTVTSVLAILGVPGAPAADKVAQTICTELEKKTQAGLTAPGQTVTLTVNGVPVTGTLK
jgi:hypothetical protein